MTAIFFLAEVSKPELARTANLVRKKILAEVRSGALTCAGVRWEVSLLDYEQFQDIITKNFHFFMQPNNSPALSAN